MIWVSEVSERDPNTLCIEMIRAMIGFDINLRAIRCTLADKSAITASNEKVWMHTAKYLRKA